MTPASAMILHDPAALEALLNDYLHRSLAERNDDRETMEHANALREAFGLAGGPVLLSGHQPIFFHPGILIKDCLLQNLAERTKGTVATLILDTDQGKIDFSWPAMSSHGTAVRRSVSLAEPGIISAASRFSFAKKQNMLEALESALLELSRALSPVAAVRARPYLLFLLGQLEETDDLVDFSTSVRRFHARRMGWKVVYLRASELIRTPAFRFFAAKILNRSDEFRNIHNETLIEYRRQHEIRNHAQPFPDLKDGELPFWLLSQNRRLPLTEALLREKAGVGEASDSLFEAGRILPRAITLSLFLRMFVCDLFVHGTGGGRYDRITAKVIERFFKCQVAPHTVATATLTLEPRADHPLESREAHEISRDLRRMEFDPVTFLPPECPLQRERQILIELRKALMPHNRGYALSADAGRKIISGISEDQGLPRGFVQRMKRLGPLLQKEAANPPALLHREFCRLRRKAERHLRQQKEDLNRESEREKACRENRRVFHNRTFPFFFYDLAPMEEALKGYATKGPDGQGSRVPVYR